MKKSLFTVLNILLAVLLLAACSRGAPPVVPTAPVVTTGPGGTPTVMPTTAVTLGATGTPAGAETGTATSPAGIETQTPAAGATSAVTGTPATGGGGGVTGTPQTTGTPGEGIPPTGPIATLSPNESPSPTVATTQIYVGTPFGPDQTGTPGASGGTETGAGTQTPIPGVGTPTPVSGDYNPATPTGTSGTSGSGGAAIATAAPTTVVPTKAASGAANPTVVPTTAPIGTTSQMQFLKLTDMLKWKVNTSSGTPVGQVNGLMIERPVLPEAAEETAVPGAASPTAVPPSVTGPQGIFVRYLLVNAAGTSSAAESGGNQVLVPWQALAIDPATAASGTVALNSAVTDLSKAPHFSLVDLATGSTDWSSTVNTYWADLGITIPSAAGQPTDMVLIPSDYRGINITDAKDAAVGLVDDFLVDPNTGEVLYAIFDAGSAFNNRVYVLPLKNLVWNNGIGTMSGDLKFNFPTETLNTAPFFNNLKQVVVDLAFIKALNQFWQSMK